MKTQKHITLPEPPQHIYEEESILASLVMNGDISRLTPAQKVNYYKRVCDKLGLDPMSQPFRILRLHGKEILYCHRGGAQQLNKLHKVSHEIKARETVNGCFVVSAKAGTPDGRKTESIGAVPIAGLKGEQLCNAMMKAETKAKRRATLDLLGLGILDETEIPPNATDIELSANELQQAGQTNNKAFPDSLFLSDSALARSVKECNDEDGLLVLYNDNKARIEVHPELKHLFTERKMELRGKIAA